MKRKGGNKVKEEREEYTIMRIRGEGKVGDEESEERKDCDETGKPKKGGKDNDCEKRKGTRNLMKESRERKRFCDESENKGKVENRTKDSDKLIGKENGKEHK